MAHVSEFVIDVILGSTHNEIRSSAATHFHRLCLRESSDSKDQLPVKKSKAVTCVFYGGPGSLIQCY